MWKFVTREGRRKVSVVRIRENIWAFGQDKRNYPLYAGVRRAGFQCITIITVNGIIIIITMMIIVVIVVIVVAVIIIIIIIVIIVDVIKCVLSQLT